jgi:hypothetical protein
MNVDFLGIGLTDELVDQLNNNNLSHLLYTDSFGADSASASDTITVCLHKTKGNASNKLFMKTFSTHVTSNNFMPYELAYYQYITYAYTDKRIRCVVPIIAGSNSSTVDSFQYIFSYEQRYLKNMYDILKNNAAYVIECAEDRVVNKLPIRTSIAAGGVQYVRTHHPE